MVIIFARLIFGIIFFLVLAYLISQDGKKDKSASLILTIIIVSLLLLALLSGLLNIDIQLF
jgi:ABC-type Fe3+-siderophore transport system permease subunit